MNKDLAEKLLVADFGESFSQLRHYDSMLWEAGKHVGALSFAIVGAAFAFLEFGQESADLSDHRLTAAWLVGIAGIVSVLGVVIATRARAYYVKTARYLNGLRRDYQAHLNAGPTFDANLWVNPDYPRYFELFSSHWLVIYLLVVVSGTQFAVAASLSRVGVAYDAEVFWQIALAIISLLAGMIACASAFRKYLEARSGKKRADTER